jgi:UDP-2,3-diacylglucosamine pyrophosphatase LpxH
MGKFEKYYNELSEAFINNPTKSTTSIAKELAALKGFKYNDSFRRYVSNLRNNKIKKNPVKKISVEQESFDESKDSASWEYKGERSITTLEEALKFSKVNLKKWEVERWVFNSWDVTSKNGKATNYQVKVWFKVKDEKLQKTLECFYDKIHAKLSLTPEIIITTQEREKNIGVVPLADFHIGAHIRDLIKTQNFDTATVIAMLDDVALEINKRQYSEVHIAIIGDLIESFTGLNHPNSWKSIGYGEFGFNIMIIAYEILENFLSKIINLTAVYAVSGNHDRSTSSNKLDQEGDFLKGVMYFIKKYLNDKIIVEYHPLVINKVIDNISYIFTHGHQRFASKIIEKIILDYGVQGLFNLVIQGHWHKRGKKSPIITNVETIYCDSADYRGIICPSLFTGNFYSEALGFSSTPGFLQFWNRLDKPAMTDLPLG